MSKFRLWIFNLLFPDVGNYVELLQQEIEYLELHAPFRDLAKARETHRVMTDVMNDLFPDGVGDMVEGPKRD